MIHPGQDNAEMKALILDESGAKFNNALSVTFENATPPASLTASLLGGVLWVLQNSNLNTELDICASTDICLRPSLSTALFMKITYWMLTSAYGKRSSPLLTRGVDVYDSRKSSRTLHTL
jgi:hypothetical protein